MKIPRSVAVLLWFFVACPVAIVSQVTTCLDGVSQGYTTLQALQNDIRARLDEIVVGAPVLDLYEFVLCPNSAFNLDDAINEGDPFRPNLPNSRFSCGADGDVLNDCRIQGGRNQVVLQGSSMMGFIQMVGVTFEQFTGTSIVTTVTPDFHFECHACIWQDFVAQSVLEQRGITPGDVLLQDFVVQRGVTSNNMFWNEGGTMEIQNGLIFNSYTAGSFISTAGALGYSWINGTVIRDNEALGNGRDYYLVETTTQAYTVVTDSTFSRNNGTQIGIATFDASSLTKVEFCTMEENGPISPVEGRGSPAMVGAYGGAIAFVRNSVLSDNVNFNALILAFTGSVISGWGNTFRGGTVEFPIYVSGGSYGVFYDSAASGIRTLQGCPGGTPQQRIVFSETTPTSECFQTLNNTIPCEGVCVQAAVERRGLPCPGGLTTLGFSSMSVLNGAMALDTALVADGFDVLPLYEYQLCPGSTFDLDTYGSLTPQQPNSLFYCDTGLNLPTDDDCVFVGGSQQVILANTEYSNAFVDMVGIAFEYWTGASIYTTNASDVTFTCQSCTWRNFSGTGITNQGGDSTLDNEPAKIILRSPLVAGGTISNVMFWNQDGIFEIHNGLVANNTGVLEAIFRTQGPTAESLINATILQGNSPVADDFYLVDNFDSARCWVLDSQFLQNSGTQVAVTSIGANVVVERCNFQDVSSVNPLAAQKLPSLIGSYDGGRVIVTECFFEQTVNYIALLLVAVESVLFGSRVAIIGGSAEFAMFASSDSYARISHSSAEGLAVSGPCPPSLDQTIFFAESSLSPSGGCLDSDPTTACQGTCLTAEDDNRGLPCASDPSIRGFSTLLGLQADLDYEVSRVVAGGASPLPIYSYTLCPGSVFDLTGTEGLVMRLSGIVLTCGSDGATANDCVMRGAATQIKVEPIGELTEVTLQIQGVTFEGFTETSILSDSSVPTDFELQDCLFRGFASHTVLMQSGSNSMTVRNSVFMNGDASEYIVRNVGGDFSLRQSTLAEVAAPVLISTNGTASSLTVVGVTISDNVATGDDMIIVDISGGASADISETSLLRNTGVQFGVRAVTGSSLILSGSTFDQNRVVRPSSLPTAVVGAVSQSSVAVSDSVFSNNGRYSAFLLAYSESQLSGSAVNIVSGSAAVPIFIDKDSDGSFTDSISGSNLDVQECSELIVFREDATDVSCLAGSDDECEGVCESARDGGATTEDDVRFTPSGALPPRRFVWVSILVISLTLKGLF